MSSLSLSVRRRIGFGVIGVLGMPCCCICSLLAGDPASLNSLGLVVACRLHRLRCRLLYCVWGAEI